MFAAHHKLSNLIGIVDQDGQQAIGHTKDVLNLEPLAERWKSFGWDVHEVDGHQAAKLKKVLSLKGNRKPKLIIARTTFGKGVSFMENKIKWHYFPMSDGDFQIAMEEIKNLAKSHAR